MKKTVLLVCCTIFLATTTFSQTDNVWEASIINKVFEHIMTHYDPVYSDTTTFVFPYDEGIVVAYHDASGERMLQLLQFNSDEPYDLFFFPDEHCSFKGNLYDGRPFATLAKEYKIYLLNKAKSMLADISLRKPSRSTNTYPLKSRPHHDIYLSMTTASIEHPEIIASSYLETDEYIYEYDILLKPLYYTHSDYRIASGIMYYVVTYHPKNDKRIFNRHKFYLPDCKSLEDGWHIRPYEPGSQHIDIELYMSIMQTVQKEFTTLVEQVEAKK